MSDSNSLFPLFSYVVDGPLILRASLLLDLEILRDFLLVTKRFSSLEYERAILLSDPLKDCFCLDLAKVNVYLC